MPKTYEHMTNDVVITLAVLGDQGAREERLLREIMCVDGVEWAAAVKTMEEIGRFNKASLRMPTLPYKLGIFAALTAAICSVPLVFELNTVLWFNELFVTTDVPEDNDLETPLEVRRFPT